MSIDHGQQAAERYASTVDRIQAAMDDQIAQAHRDGRCTEAGCDGMVIESGEWLETIPLEPGWHGVMQRETNTYYDRVTFLVRVDLKDTRHEVSMQMLMPMTGLHMRGDVSVALSTALSAYDSLHYFGADSAAPDRWQQLTSEPCTTCDSHFNNAPVPTDTGYVVSRLCSSCRAADEVDDR